VLAQDVKPGVVKVFGIAMQKAHGIVLIH
jgi:hypothetical protein